VAVQPLISSGAVVAREPNLTDPTTLPPRQVEALVLPPPAATMDDRCRIGEMLPPPSGEAALTIAILSLVSQLELSSKNVGPMSAFGGEAECARRPARSRWCKSITMKE
jgi:hypothetical protein